MFCRKCGHNILDDSVFCSHCGTKIVTINKTVDNEKKISKLSDEKLVHIKNEHSSENELIPLTKNTTVKKQNIFLYLCIFVSIIILFVIIMLIVNEAAMCSLSSCDNIKKEGYEYCNKHLCEYSGCDNLKSYDSDVYCYSHKKQLSCIEDDCDLLKVEGGEYCSSHTCDKSDCFLKKSYDSEYCFDHQINMRELLTTSSFGFKLNSAGGIKFSFSAKNSTGKTIKYVRFKAYMQNAVGDRIAEDITDNYYIEVEIIGPVKKNEWVTMSDEIIGYCDNLYRLDINDITIVYTDGTSETGSFNYYTTK